MNRQKSAPHTTVSPFLIVVLSFSLITFGGIRYAMLKNQQVQTHREIDAVEQRIGKCLLDIRTIEMRSEALLDQITLRKQLAEMGTDLRHIPPGFAEEITRPTPPAAIAATQP